MEKLASLQGIYRGLAVIGGELLVLLAVSIVVILVMRLIFKWLGSLSTLQAHRERLIKTRRFVRGILLLALLILSAGLLPFPPTVSSALWIILRIYLIISIGMLVVRTVAAMVESLKALSCKYLVSRGLPGLV